MRLTKSQHVVSSVLMLIPLICLSNCGSSTGISGSQPSSKPDHVQIEIDLFHQSTRQNPVVNLTIANMVQQLFATIYALPQMPENIPCTLEMGIHYTLTFYQGHKKLVTVVAENDGCRCISLSGEPQVRTAMNNPSFWKQLDHAIYEASPTATIAWSSLRPLSSTPHHPQTARITSADTAQHLYNAILALPTVMENNSYLGPGDYQLVFHTSDQPVVAVIDMKQKLVDLHGEYHSRGGVSRMNEQFEQLWTKVLAGIVFSPARPDTLLLSLSTNKDSRALTVRDTKLVQEFYTRIFTFSTTQPPPDSCLGNDKVAGKQKWYELTFLQWNLTLLHVSAYEASCVFVERDFDSGQRQYLQADQQFWTLLHQAVNQ